ncbi:hypothetical protein [Streptomyces anandii]|uniref:hypothetical protein n=1 Tax=Streptomyces anandii TaxID=285454 RepID=UPI000AB78932|nr:hypothetical protein [Streptomyces anandii]GGX82882.1 hypothetical protein GCM10010510_29700 [Streptomyces anandii JCM 4720]
MAKLQEVLDILERRIGMCTTARSFSEACAFLDGFEMCSESATMKEFRAWLAERRTGSNELTWWGLVLCEVDPALRVPDVRSFSPERHQEAVGVLFSLLREYLRTLGSE